MSDDFDPAGPGPPSPAIEPQVLNTTLDADKMQRLLQFVEALKRPGCVVLVIPGEKLFVSRGIDANVTEIDGTFLLEQVAGLTQHNHQLLEQVQALARANANCAKEIQRVCTRPSKLERRFRGHTARR